MTTGLKIWLWLVFVVNAISAVISIIAALVLPMLWVTVIATILVIVGAVMLLQTKKTGFYLICGASVIALIINVVSGQNIVSSLISAVLMPLIIYLLMRKTWNEFV